MPAMAEDRMRANASQAVARFRDARLIGDVWVVLNRFFDEVNTATGLENLEWWGYVEFLEPLDDSIRERIDGGEPFELVSPSVRLQSVFGAARRDRQCYLVVEAAQDV